VSITSELAIGSTDPYLFAATEADRTKNRTIVAIVPLALK
jgi:hypothetical protein